LASENLSAISCEAFEENGLASGVFPGDAITQNGNLGTLDTKGLDFAVAYSHPLSDSLTFDGKLKATHQNSYEEDFQLGGTIELSGTADGFGVYPEWRMNSSFGLKAESWSIDWIIRWLSETNDLWRSPATSADTVAESIIYNDLVGTYAYENIKVIAGINNLTDEEPPYFHSAFNANTEPGVYDVVGRRLFVSVTLSL
jgi:iron complex outermembrane receptor protein